LISVQNKTKSVVRTMKLFDFSVNAVQQCSAVQCIAMQ
jgi:hypothetical protein